MKSKVLGSLIFLQALLVAAENSQSCPDRYYQTSQYVKNYDSKMKGDLPMAGFSGALLGPLSIGSMPSYSSDMVKADKVSSGLKRMTDLYNQALMGDGPELIKFSKSLVKNPNLEIMSSTIVDLFEQNIFCNNICSPFEYGISKNDVTTMYISNLCLPDEAANYVLREYALRNANMN